MAGIDYGRGQTNIDHSTGIRYGVIPQNVILQAWTDSSEADYGDAFCPQCGRGASIPEYSDEDDTQESDEYVDYNGIRNSRDYRCDDCKIYFDGDVAFGNEPLGFYFDSDGIKAFSDSMGDIFIIKSPYYTRADFCSPCAPGACYLTSPNDNGAKAYCFDESWFDDDIEVCPYPIWRIENDELSYWPNGYYDGILFSAK